MLDSQTILIMAIVFGFLIGWVVKHETSILWKKLTNKSPKRLNKRDNDKYMPFES